MIRNTIIAKEDAGISHMNTTLQNKPYLYQEIAVSSKHGSLTKMYKQVRVRTLFYEMLLEVAKRNRSKPEDLMEKLIEGAYNSGK